MEYELTITQSVQVIQCQRGAVIRMVAAQGGKICLWMEVDQSAEKEKHRFLVVGTGWELPEERNYIGSVVMGAYVWHVFEDRGERIVP